jgi:hypothetical protein
MAMAEITDWIKIFDRHVLHPTVEDPTERVRVMMGSSSQKM